MKKESQKGGKEGETGDIESVKKVREKVKKKIILFSKIYENQTVGFLRS